MSLALSALLARDRKAPQAIQLLNVSTTIHSVVAAKTHHDIRVLILRLSGRETTHCGVLLLLQTRHLVKLPVCGGHSHVRDDGGHQVKTHTEKGYLVVYLPLASHQVRRDRV
jgi:hypothetical protein